MIEGGGGISYSWIGTKENILFLKRERANNPYFLNADRKNSPFPERVKGKKIPYAMHKKEK
jgi:hypothetical protein